MNAQQVEALNELLDKKGFYNLKCKSTYEKGYDCVIDIISLPYWDDERFIGALGPNIFKSNKEQIIELLELPYWDDPKNVRLLTPSIWGFKVPKVVEAMETYKSLRLLDYIQVSSLRRSKIEIVALYHYFKRNRLAIIVNGKLHSLFSITAEAMFKNYGISLKWLVQMEKEKQNKL